MTTSELMTIGAFAAATGLTPGALRFYSDSSMLRPAHIDESSGYRYYTEAQAQHAVTIRRLREMGMPLVDIAQVIAGDPALVDRHVTELFGDARRARRIAAELRASIHQPEENTMITVNGPSFADAVDRILTATAHSPEHPVLNGLFLEIRADALTMTATDRYRLSTRTIAATQHDSDDWSVVVDGDDLRAAMPLVRSRHRIRIEVDRNGVDFGSGDRYCRALPEQFPDYSAVFDAMPPVVTRIVLSRNALVHALEERQSEYVTCAVSQGRLELSEPGTVGPVVVDAVVRGPAVTMAFAVTTLYPAVVSAIGPDVMIDVSGPTMPVVVRSADGGDLTTLAMPVDPAALT